MRTRAGSEGVPGERYTNAAITANDGSSWVTHANLPFICHEYTL